MATAVVCEDDPVTRRTISAICEQVGLHVVAEVDGGADAVELARRFGVDVLVLDLGLGEGLSGKDTLRAMQHVVPYPKVVVFTAYADDPDGLIRLGAHAVVEKPHLDRLIAVLDELATEAATSDADHAPGEERRRRMRATTPLPEIWRSPSGISSEADLVQTLAASAVGDAIVVVRLIGLERITRDAGRLLADDARLTLARLLRATLRAQDVVHQSDTANGFVGVLRGGDGHAVVAAWARLMDDVTIAELPGQPVGAWAAIDAMGARDALARAIAALQAAPTDYRILISA